MTQTTETIHENNTLIEAIAKATKTIEIWSQDDDGEWHSELFANEAAAQEFEAKGRKRGFATKRAA